MTIAFESGYSLPGADKPLNNARILHDGNRFPIKAVTASAEVTNYEGANANRGDTVDRWRPFSNGLTAPADLSDAAWTAANVTVGSDGLTLTETTATGEHDMSQAYTFTAVEHVVAFKVERQTVPEVQVRASDGTTSFTCFFDLRDKTVGTAANCTGNLVDLGGNSLLLVIYFTPLAASGVVELLLSNGSETVSYAGSTSNTIKVDRAYAHASAATLRMDTFAASAGDVMCVAAHNLWSCGARITFEHDSNADDTFTSIGSVSPTDDSPIMFIYVPITSARWRITVDRGVLPEVGVFRVGDALQMERPFYGGFAPVRMSRNTEVIGNISGSGELLGRSKQRTTLSASYQWQNLSYAWVRANLDAPTGLIQAVEAEPCFVAWRPSDTQDVDYIMRGRTRPPTAQGARDLFNFSMSGEVHAYE